MEWVTNVCTERHGKSDEDWKAQQRLIAKHTTGPPKPNPKFNYTVSDLEGYHMMGLYKKG